MSALTQAEASEFGATLKVIRNVRGITLREVDETTRADEATRISYQYLHNIEEGTRTGFGDAIVLQLQRIYRLPDRSLDDFLLRARVRSALSQRGLSAGDADAAWCTLETRLGELGTPVNTDLAALLAGILGQPQEVRARRRRKAEEER